MIILRILLFVFNLALGSDDIFAFPDSISGYNEHISARCVAADGQSPSSLISYFLDEGPELCAYICKQQQSCSGFAFSHLEKDACELYVLQEFHDDTMAYMQNPIGFTWETTGDHIDALSVLPVTLGTVNDYANSGQLCTDFNTVPYCMLWQNWRCYVRITSEPSVSPSNSPSTSPSNSPSLSPSVIPSSSPSVDPSTGPSQQPSLAPTSDSPSVQPSNPPTGSPTLPPTTDPTVAPTNEPTVHPTSEPSSSPSLFPTTDSPSMSPSTSDPSTSPSIKPTRCPTKEPTNAPSTDPTVNPTFAPTVDPTCEPTTSPSIAPTTDSPSTNPSKSPSTSPTKCPTTETPSTSPSTRPTRDPTTNNPTKSPTVSPSRSPSHSPTTETPTIDPSVAPSERPSADPSFSPSVGPTNVPSDGPTVIPTLFPIGSPSAFPSAGPTTLPTIKPSNVPSIDPTTPPSRSPETSEPSATPTTTPSDAPSVIPTKRPSDAPFASPSTSPSVIPTNPPSVVPSKNPSTSPSDSPSGIPSTRPSDVPSVSPTRFPTSSNPSVTPSESPSVDPTRNPTTDSPSRPPTGSPTASPTVGPTVDPTFHPTLEPTLEPTFEPSQSPTLSPSKDPSTNPTFEPTQEPTCQPSTNPSVEPTVEPTFNPTVAPTVNPSNPPSVMPSKGPSTNPTVVPSDAPSIAPSETNPCSGPSDYIVGSKYVDLVLAESSFSDADVLTLTLQVPEKYIIEKISFKGGALSGEYEGVDTNYWTMTTKQDLDCLHYPQFVASWSAVQSNSLAGFTVVKDEDGVQYLFNKITLELQETVHSLIHNYQFERTVLYEMPFAIELQTLIELEVDMSMIIPTVSPSVSPSGQPSMTPTTAPSTSPSGAPTLKAMDHLFTRYALYSPGLDGSSLVDINFTTIVRLPWTVQDQEFYIIDDENDAMVDDSEVFTLLDDCYSAFKYDSFPGLCVDQNFRYPPSLYADIDADPNLCKHICDQTDECEAYDVSSTFEKCSIIGTAIDQSYTTRLASYLQGGETWTYIGTSGGSPSQGRVVPGASNFCFIKQTAAWQTDLCHSVNGAPPHPEEIPECYCFQDWNLKYQSGSVCDVSGWWTLGMTIESGETGNNLFYETRVWVGLTSACAQVIGSSEICYDEAPCSISGYDEPERITPMSKFYVTEQAYFKVTVGTNAPIGNIEILQMSLQQQGRGLVTVPTEDYRTDNLVSQPVAGTENRFSGTVDLTLDVNESTFEGTIAGVASWLSITAGITYEDGVTRRRQLTLYIPEGDKPSVDLEFQIIVYPKRCLEPEGNLGSHLVRTCPQGKTIRVCRASGWETLVAECPEDEVVDTSSEDVTDTNRPETDEVVTNTQQSGSQSIVIIENSSDNDTASFWKLLTVVAAGVVLLVVCLLWYCKQKEHEEVEKKIVQRTIEVQEDSEWDTTDYSITDTSYYQDKTNQDFAMKTAYEEIFQQYATHGHSYAPSAEMEESDV